MILANFHHVELTPPPSNSTYIFIYIHTHTHTHTHTHRLMVITISARRDRPRPNPALKNLLLLYPYKHTHTHTHTRFLTLWPEMIHFWLNLKSWLTPKSNISVLRHKGLFCFIQVPNADGQFCFFSTTASRDLFWGRSSQELLQFGQSEPTHHPFFQTASLALTSVAERTLALKLRKTMSVWQQVSMLRHLQKKNLPCWGGDSRNLVDSSVVAFYFFFFFWGTL